MVWLRRLGLGKYEAAFRENEIDETVLPSLTHETLKELGVTAAGVSGADPIETRPGFSALLDRIETNGVRTVIVEDASRFARELVTQELGIIALIKCGVRVLTANGDDLTDSSDPSREMMRQIATDCHCTSEQIACFDIAALGSKPRLLSPTQEEIIGLLIDCALSGQPVSLFRRQFDLERRNDLQPESIRPF
jgi:SAM domain (Sterile alpha motif)/Resolvase, N terminal domain